MARARKKVLVPADDRPAEPEVVTTQPAEQEAREQPPPKPRRPRKAAGSKPATRSRKPAAEPGEAARDTPPAASEIQQQVGDLARQLEEMRRQSLETREQLRQLRQQRDEAARELEPLRRQAEEAQRQFLRDTLEATQRVREEVAATEGQLRAVTQLFQEASQRLQVLPRHANELHEQFRRVAAQVPAAQKQLQSVEQEAEAARQELTTIEEESRTARQRLDTVLQETAAAEMRLASVRVDFDQAEQRLRRVQRQVETVTEEVRETAEQVDDARQEAEGVAAAAEEAAAALPEGKNRLGVTVDPGVVVADVLPDSAALAAGLARGDVISGVNGTPVFTALEMRNLVEGLADGDEVTLQVTRGGALTERKARLQAPPAGDEAPEGHNRLGVTVEPGVVVAEVLPGSSAATAGLAHGDLINTVNDTPVVTGEQLRQAVQPLPPAAEVRLQLSRGGEVREVKVRLDGPAADVPGPVGEVADRVASP